MNILFYVTCTPSPLNGGIERVSHILAKEFIKEHHTCYCIYFKKIDATYTSDVYEETFYIPYNHTNNIEKIRNIIESKNIDVVLNQVGGFWEIGKALTKLHNILKFKLLTTYHSNPIENHYILKHRYSQYNNLKEFIYFSLYHLCPSIIENRINSLKHRLFTNEILGSNKYLFLSKAYKNDVIQQYKIQDSPNIISLPNPLTYNTFFPIENYKNLKKKQVLIVARFDELYKRLSKALAIWKSLEQYGYNGWKLIIIGHGEDEPTYRKMINDLDIQEIEIIGKTSPEKYYKESSIFLMTSVLEGWPMTIQEAMQFGCIPLAFDTFSAIHEIIQDGENGYIIKDNDNTSYIQKLMDLMNDPEQRIEMAKNAIESRKKYSADKIARYWLHIIEN